MKIINLVSLVTVVVFNIIILISVYWLIYPYKPIEFNNLPHKIVNENKTVKSGGYLIYNTEYCKYSDLIPLVTKHYVDGFLYTVPQEVASFKGKGCGKTQVQIYVPKALPKGEYYIEIKYRYKVNPIRDIDITTKTEKFIVE